MRVAFYHITSKSTANRRSSATVLAPDSNKRLKTITLDLEEKQMAC